MNYGSMIANAWSQTGPAPEIPVARRVKICSNEGMIQNQILPALALGCFLVSCATPSSRTGPGLIRTDHYEGIMVTQNPAGKKRGTACSSNYFGLVTSGDATLSAAMKDGAITSVSSVDQHYESTLGVFGKVCTIVTGN